MTPGQLREQMARQLMRRHMSEDQLLQAITEAATLYGWRWHHIRRSDRAQQMGHAGFPDLVLVRGSTIVALELKTEKGRVTPEQAGWLDALMGAALPALVIRPSDLDGLLLWLRHH